MLNSSLCKFNNLQQKNTIIYKLISIKGQLSKIFDDNQNKSKNQSQLINLLVEINQFIKEKSSKNLLQANEKKNQEKIEKLLTKLNQLSKIIQLQNNAKECQSKDYLIIKSYVYQICLLIICLQQKTFTNSSSYKITKLDLFDQILQKLIIEINDSEESFKIVLKQFFGMNSLMQYAQYNIHCNQQYKFEQHVQIDFLYMMAKIKLASINCQNLSQNMEKPQTVQIIKKIFNEGKQTLQKCKNLCERSSNIKSLDIIKKINKMERYVNWIQGKYTQQEEKNLNLSNMKTPTKKGSTLKNHDLQQKKNSCTYTPIKFLLSTDKKSNFKSDYNLEQQDILDEVCIEILISSLLSIQRSLKLKNSRTQGVKQALSEQLKKSEYIRNIVQSFLKVCSNNFQLLQQNIVNESALTLLKIYIMENKIQVRRSIQNNQAFLTIFKSIQNCLQQLNQQKDDSQKGQKQKVEKNKKMQKQNIFNDDDDKLKKNIDNDKSVQTKYQKDKVNINNIVQPLEINQKMFLKSQKKNQQQMSSKKQVLSKTSKKNNKTLSVETQNPIKIKYQVCKNGQFLTKYNFNNSSSSLKFVKIHNDKLLWADHKQDINDSSQCKFGKIDGVVYGCVTKKMVQQIPKNHLQPWRCFSVLYKDRTIDFYCQQNEYDVFFWLTGISYHLRTYYSINIKFSTGKILWKKILMKLREKYLKQKSKTQKLKKFYLGRDNAQAIINFSKQKQNKQ